MRLFIITFFLKEALSNTINAYLHFKVSKLNNPGLLNAYVLRLHKYSVELSLHSCLRGAPDTVFHKDHYRNSRIRKKLVVLPAREGRRRSTIDFL